MPFTPGAHPGILHHYDKRLVAFEHAVPSSSSTAAAAATNFVLFLGGLTDSLMTVRYPTVLASRLPPHWAVAQVHLTSSGAGWTHSTLARDADEAARAVSYFRALAALRNPATTPRILLLGHSTGSQIAATYLVGPWRQPAIPDAVRARPPPDAVVLQAGISDREGIVDIVGPAAAAAALETARGMVADGRGADAMPGNVTAALYGAGPAPSAARLVSLLDPEGDDDLFSSDLDEGRVQRVFGAGGIGGRGVPLLVLLGGADEHMPAHVDREALVRRWEGAVRGAGGVWDEGSGVVPGAGHNLNGSPESAVDDLCGRIARLAARVDAGGGDGGGRL